MASEVKLPRLGQGMESGTIVKWLKSVGDRVEKGDPLYEVDTDKATQEVEAEASGVLLNISVESGEVPVGEIVALIGEQGEAAESSKDAPVEAARSEPTVETADDDAEPEAAPAPARKAAPAPAAGRGTDFRKAINGSRGAVKGERVKASPLARRIALERGIDLAGLTGTGPDGRVVAEDVERAAAGASPPASVPVEAVPAEAEPVETEPVEAAEADVDDEVAPAEQEPELEPEPERAEEPAVADETDELESESIPLTSIRKTIARRLTAAAQIPVFQLTVSVEMTHADELVERSRELNPDVRVTVTDLLAKVCARALMRHREVNAQFTEEALLLFKSANVGIAVAAPQGLVVPVIRSVERLSLIEVAQARTDLVQRSRDGKLQQSDLADGTFTISNLGMFGVEQFTAVLNPPQAAILAVGTTTDQPVIRDGEVVVRPMMTVTLTVDHRAVDGGPAADFLRTLKTFLEDPALAL